MNSCSWPGNDSKMLKYHDEEWCVPSFEDRYIFEMLCLEGAQAGLSWQTVINKREEYMKAFHNFEIEYCAKLSDHDLEKIKDDFSIIKNRLKINAVRNNAQAAMKVQNEFGSLSKFFWNYTDGKPIINNWDTLQQMPAQTELSERISKDLKKRGFKFVGAVIIYSFLQAIGMVDDHIQTCPHHTSNRDKI